MCGNPSREHNYERREAACSCPLPPPHPVEKRGCPGVENGTPLNWGPHFPVVCMDTTSFLCILHWPSHSCTWFLGFAGLRGRYKCSGCFVAVQCAKSSAFDESGVPIVHELECMPLEVLYDAFGSVCVELVLNSLAWSLSEVV